MLIRLVDCDVCSDQLVADALFCPRCLDSRRTAGEEWFPVDESGSDNHVVHHDYVPEHRIFPEKKVDELMREYDISRTDLPKITESDPALEHLSVAEGDVIEIVRDSRTAGEATVYRLVVSDSTTKGSSSTAEWRNPDEPADDIYERSEQVTEDQARHILENIRAHVPPTEPGACRRIAVNREAEIETARNRLRNGEPYTFIQGELGYGKSFFLHWIRDETFASSAVSIIDLGDDTTFRNPGTIVRTFRDRLMTPRSLANDEYANGLDELWDTFLRQVSDLCAGYYEAKGYEIRDDRMVESIGRATDAILGETGISDPTRSKMVDAAADHFDDSLQSLSHSLLDDISDATAFDHLEVMATLSRLNGYRLLLGVDELEKAERSADHFEAIADFVESLPENVSLFVTGTPELVEGKTEANAFRETTKELYELTSANRIRLDSPETAHLREFTEKVRDLEKRALPTSQREYSTAVEEHGGVESIVEAFLADQPPTFRGYLEFLEDT